ncbi:hypothetical protein EV286_101554 [Rhizobium sp. BK251]|nr:hypothetical protein EV286_101554 [Rhizobium sp. BK251]
MIDRIRPHAGNRRLIRNGDFEKDPNTIAEGPTR